MAKSVADNFVISDEHAEAIKNNLQTGTFGVRLFMYIFFYIILFFLWGWATSTFNIHNGTLELIVWLLPPILPLYLKELSIRHWRKKNGFSIYKDIKEEIKQAEVDKRVAMEKKAYAKHGINQTEGL